MIYESWLTLSGETDIIEEFMSQDPPYLIVPELAATLDCKTLVEGLPDGAATRVIYPKDMPSALGAPVGGDAAIALVKATEWVLSLNAERLTELSAWFVGTYGAKEFVKGFAGEAGKDTWNAIKNLLARIRDWSTNAPATKLEAMLPLRVEAAYRPTGTGDRKFEVVLDPRWDSNEVDRRLMLLERMLLPAVFAFLKETERVPSNNREKFILGSARIVLSPDCDGVDGWWLDCQDSLETGVVLLVEMTDHSFRWDKRVWKAGLIANILFEVLQAKGFTNRGEDTALVSSRSHH